MVWRQEHTHGWPALWTRPCTTLPRGRSCAYTHGARKSRGEKLLKDMEVKSASVCEVTFGIVFDICVARGDFDAAQSVFDELQRLGVKANATHHTSFMQS